MFSRGHMSMLSAYKMALFHCQAYPVLLLYMFYAHLYDDFPLCGLMRVRHSR